MVRLSSAVDRLETTGDGGDGLMSGGDGLMFDGVSVMPCSVARNGVDPCGFEPGGYAREDFLLLLMQSLPKTAQR